MALAAWRTKLSRTLPSLERALGVASLDAGAQTAHLRARAAAIAAEVKLHETELQAEAAEAEAAVSAASVAAATAACEKTLPQIKAKVAASKAQQCALTQRAAALRARLALGEAQAALLL